MDFYNLNISVDYNYSNFYYDKSNYTNEKSNMTVELWEKGRGLTGVYIDDILRNMSITLYSIIFLLGIIGNGLVIWIAGFRMKKTISAVWFLNLAIADFLCCASLPLRIPEWFYFYSDTSNTFCKLSIILFTINMSASVLLLAAMSIDRCVSVMWPFWAKVHRTLKLVRITAAIIWLFSLLWTGLMFYLYVFYFTNVTEWCHFYDNYYDFHHIKQIIQLIRLIIMFVIPFLIILISYVIIFLTLRKSKRPQRSQRPYRIITAVILCFFLCWSPYYIWPLTFKYDGYYSNIRRVNIVIINLACLNSCINPIIYVFMGQDFKHNFLKSILSRLERALGDPTNDLSREREDCEHIRLKDV